MTLHLLGFYRAASNHMCSQIILATILIAGFGDSAQVCSLDTPTSYQKQTFHSSTKVSRLFDELSASLLISYRLTTLYNIPL